MSMKKIVLQRLIDSIESAAHIKTTEAENLAAQTGRLLAEMRLELGKANQRLTTATNDLEILRRKDQESSVPLTDLYRACENILRAKTLSQFNAAKPRLGLAMAAAEKYLDLIPF